MKRLLNISGFQYAEALIRLGKIDFSDVARSIESYSRDELIRSKGFGAYSQFHLGQDDEITDANTQSKYHYCFSTDFWTVSRALLLQVKADATTAGEKEIADKAEELIGLIDQKQMSVMFGVADVAISDAKQTDKKGWKWDVTIIRAGKTQTNPAVYVPVAALSASLDVFEGSKVYANAEADANGHKKDRNKKVSKDIVAILSKPYVQGEELKATMTILPSGKWLRDNLFAMHEENLPFDSVYQLSIDSSIDAKRSFVAAINETLPVVNRIVKADVDIVGEAAAGGRINRLAASNIHNNQQGATTMRQKLLSILFFFPVLLAGKTNEDWNKVQENELYSHLLQAGKGFLPDSLPEGLTEQAVDTLVAAYRDNADKVKSLEYKDGKFNLQAAKPPTNPAAPPNPAPANITDLQAALDEQKKRTDELVKSQCASLLAARTEVLPVPLRDSLRKRFKDKTFTVAELESAINEGRELITPFMQTSINNHGLDIRPGMDGYDKIQASADLFFLMSNQGLNPLKAGSDEHKAIAKGMTPFRSIKEFYIQATGDVNVTGRQDRNMRLTASLETSDWANILLDALNKRLVRDYFALQLDTWRAWVTIRDGVKDFKAQNTVRYGGYGNLPTVAEGGPYTGLTSPGDEKLNWSPAKRGGTEDLTRELILNDDVSAVQRIPTRMARAAAQTLHEFIYDFIRPGVNPVIYDAVALYHANHANTGTAALAADGVALAAARLRMKKQAMLTNGKRIGIRAGFLIVPSDLESIAYGLLTPAFNKSNEVPEFLQKIGITPIVVDYWADATDWVLAGRKEDTEMVEVGFVNGQETPQLFVSDLPNAGSFFTHDKVTYKIRHEYGGAIVDWRGLDGSIVA